MGEFGIRLCFDFSENIFNFYFLSFFFKLSRIEKNNLTMKTYGEKPIVFKFPGDENEYMIGSEVGNYMRLFRGALYKRFPALTRRNMTVDERKRLVEMGHSNH